MNRRARLYQLQGIVLGRRDHGEADRVIVCLTPNGRVDLLAKGTRKPRSRKAGHLELFARADMLISRVSGSWDIISQVEAQALRPILQDDFQRGTYARYVTELVMRFFEGESDTQLFSLLDSTLARLEKDADPRLLVRWYEQRLLILAGFRPQWHECVGEKQSGVCGNELIPRPSDSESYGLDPERGGALCAACFSALEDDTGVRRLSPSALSWLQALQWREYDELKQFQLPDATGRELDRVMQHYIAYHLEYRPTSLRFYADMK